MFQALLESFKKFKITVLFLKNKKHLLMAPGNIYDGAWGGFLIADSTRSYVACGYGYSSVSISFYSIIESGVIAS